MKTKRSDTLTFTRRMFGGLGIMLKAGFTLGTAIAYFMNPFNPLMAGDDPFVRVSSCFMSAAI